MYVKHLIFVCSYSITMFIFYIIAIYPVRLSNGTESSGHIELLFNGRWGTVCDDNFDRADGQVVCRQLNQGSISRIANPLEFPVGTSDQPIWLHEVRCTGNERWLSARVLIPGMVHMIAYMMKMLE